MIRARLLRGVLACLAAMLTAGAPAGALAAATAGQGATGAGTSGTGASGPGVSGSVMPAVEEILERNIAARGGLEAWKQIRTMAWRGHIESVRAGESSLPFLLELKRPNKTHFEIDRRVDKSARIFDGAVGWKVRLGPDRRPDVKPYTIEELRFAQESHVIDGPLIDHRAKHAAITLDGIEEIDGRKAYRLAAALPSGSLEHVWVDAETWLDLKSDRSFRNSAGLTARSIVYYGDYREVEGVRIPFLVQTAAGAGQTPDKLVIESVALNPELDDRIFSQPNKALDRGRSALPEARPRIPRPGVAQLPAVSEAPAPAAGPAGGAAGSAGDTSAASTR